MSRKKVMLGMSGGVDSSVAAALILEQGYDVVGVTMDLYYNSDDTAIDDAKKVADVLNIPHYVISFRDIFKDKVIDYFIDDYLKGKTPNPCVACNKHIKFGALFQTAASMGINYIATGHYAMVTYDINADRFLLKKATTKEKDQSYVLYNLNQEKLSKILLPLGEYSKEEVRGLAQRFNLPSAAKPDSQDICFIQDNDYIKFINETTSVGENLGSLAGDFIDTKGNVLGQHKGIMNYTIGQRKGLGITFGIPKYVIKVDSINNKVVLGDHEELFSKELIATNVNYVSIDKLNGKLQVGVKIRYSAKEAPAILESLEGGEVKVIFDQPQRAITPGQSAVFYQDDVVVGGGIIK